ncbi:Histone deacetylase complex subunit SAP30L [Mizuhopecten yessoensis]|uniref:Histone deacetylase complex subunit SAP30L n=1 Tax=Mizuhopecten yessoensis TaxID=6573 RepID=A0A210QR14_MIZYE|nr:Histone deacetylase complex subunit SAP30L [Mizuhopecten yessoensis]
MSMNGFSTEEDSRGGHDQICCLFDAGERCTNQAGNASYSKRIQKTVQQRKLKLVRDDSVAHIYICDYHKNVIQSVRAKRKRKDSEDGNGSPNVEEDLPEIDFFQMPVNTLRRYKRHYKLMTRPGMNNKAQLADTVARHFKTITVNEKEALTYFIYMAKNYKSRFDQKHLDNKKSCSKKRQICYPRLLLVGNLEWSLPLQTYFKVYRCASQFTDVFHSLQMCFTVYR